MTRQVVFLIFVCLFGTYSESQAKCIAVDNNLNMTISCAEYKGVRYQFNLNFFSGDHAPIGFYWKTDSDSMTILYNTSDDCIKVSDDLTLTVPCAEYLGARYSFILKFYPNPDDPSGIYWKMDSNSLKETDSKIDYTLFSSACKSDFKGVPGTNSYDRSKAGPHPIVLMSSDGKKHDWNSKLPSDWIPKFMGDVELVACIKEGSETVESCQYSLTGNVNIGYVYRKQQYADITIVSASTGQTIATNKIYGSTPSLCPDTYSFKVNILESPMPGYINGNTVAFDDVKGWLTYYVNWIFPFGF